jgi:dCMP deaminase
MLHLREEYWLMLRNKIAVKQLSNFNSESEAVHYLESISKQIAKIIKFDHNKKYGDRELLELASKASLASWDWTFRAGAVLSKNGEVIATSHNTVLPAEYSMLLKGSRKEKYFSPPQDQNFYDTNHAEMELLITAAAKSVNLSECEMHVNLMPCEGCARVLARSGIKKIIYGIEQTQKHSYEILKSSGVDVMLEA